jgi:hypothetical protein
MSNASWKDHERFVAKFFNTSRRNRGNDFGQSDVEIMTTLEEWLGWPTQSTVGLIVECKYSKRHPIVDVFKSYDIYDKPTIIVAGDTMYIWLEDFSKLFIDYIWTTKEENKDLFEIVYDFNIINIADSEPDYINKYIQQARDYTIKYSSQGTFLPIACIAKAKAKRRLVCVNIDDILRFKTLCHKEISFDNTQDVTSNRTGNSESRTDSASTT